MAIINRPRLRNVLVGREIADEPAAVEVAEVFAEEVEASQADFVTQEEQSREVGRLEAVVERAVERIEAKLDRFEARLDRFEARLDQFGAKLESEIGRIDGRIDAQHSETRAYIAESHLRTVAIVLGGLAVATAILAIVIAVT